MAYLNVVPLLFKGCAKFLDIGGNWNTLSSRASQTCSMGDMSAEYAGHGRTGPFSASGNCVQILASSGSVPAPVNIQQLFTAINKEEWDSSGNRSGGHFLQSACQLRAPSKLETSVVLCCVTKLHILGWPFIVHSTRLTCVIISFLICHTCQVDGLSWQR